MYARDSSETTERKVHLGVGGGGWGLWELGVGVDKTPPPGKQGAASTHTLATHKLPTSYTPSVHL